MSKKHFIALADAMRELTPKLSAKDRQLVLDSLASFCAWQNPQFKRERWLAYIAGECGSNGGKVKPLKEAA